MSEARERELLRLGAICAFLMALAFLVAGGTVFLDPSQKSAARAWQIRLLTPGWFVTGRLALLTASLAGLGVAQCLEQSSLPSRQGAASWLRRLAELSFFTMALSSIQILSVDVPYRWVDPRGQLWLTGIGVWALGTSWLRWGRAGWPRATSALGISTGVLLGAVPLASWSGDQVLWTLLVFGGSTIAGPLWLFSLASFWRRELASTSAISTTAQ